MKVSYRVFASFVFFMMFVSLQAQNNRLEAEFDLILPVTPTNGGTYAYVGFFRDLDSRGYSTSDIDVDTTVVQDNRGYRYLVVYSSNTDPDTLELDPLDVTTAPLTGTVQIYNPTTYHSFQLETGGTVDKNRASGTSNFRVQLDSILHSIQATTSSGSPKDTVTTAVAVAPLDPLHFDGTQWVKASRTTYKFAWAIVVDTISSTQAIIQSIGFAKIPSHGLTVGEKYGLANETIQLTSTIDTTQYKQWLFNVIDANTLDLKLSSKVEPPNSYVDSLTQVIIDTTRLDQDTILIHYRDGGITSRDTIRGFLKVEVDGSITNELQTVDSLILSGDDLVLALQNDNETPYTLDLSSFKDTTALVQDTILVHYIGGSEISRDTIRGFIKTPQLADSTAAVRADFPVIDSTRLTQDSILIYYQAGSEVDRDTIRLPDLDEQTASEVSITDSGGFYTASEVEAALQEVGDSLTQHRTDIDLINANESHGSVSDVTDLGGDITVAHGLGTASITVVAVVTGTTHATVQVHNKTGTNFSLRFFDNTGTELASTAVTADWIAKKQ